MNSLTCNCVPRLDGVSAAELGRLFPKSSTTAPLLSLLQESGFEGFNLWSIVVLKDGAPILLLPLFETRFDLSTFVEGWIKRSLEVAGRLVSSLFHPRVLSVGLAVGEWGEIGVDPQMDEGTLDAASKMAFCMLQALAAELKSDILALYNFNRYSILPGDVFKTFNQVQYGSCARLRVDFNSMEEYLSRLSKATRKDLLRKVRVAPDVRIIRSCTISPFLDRIYRLYQELLQRSPMSLGAHNRIFFEKICDRVPGTEYTLYFVQEELAAFNLLVVTPHGMEDKYFCMDYGIGRKYNLYVLSWFENVRTCVERKIPLYLAGPGAEKTKAHLGATLIPSFILFKHRYPVIDRFLMAWPAVSENILCRLGFWPAASPATPDVLTRDQQEPTHARPHDTASQVNDRKRGTRHQLTEKA